MARKRVISAGGARIVRVAWLNTMTKHPKITPGDIIAVQLEPELFSVGLILHISKAFKNGIMVGFYDCSFNSLANIRTEELGGEFIFTPNYTSKKLVILGPWKLIGHSGKLLADAKIPELLAGNSVYHKDNIVKDMVPPDEQKRYPSLTGQGGIFVENKLRKYFQQKQ